MGANIPLPALAFNPQQQQAALAPGQQQIQKEQIAQQGIATKEAQLALQDKQGFDAALKDTYSAPSSSPQGGDQVQSPTDPASRLEALQQRLQDPKYGISLEGQTKAMQQYQQLRESISKADKESLSAGIESHKLISQKLSSVLESAPEDQAAAWTLAAHQLMRDPTMRKFANVIPAAYPGIPQPGGSPEAQSMLHSMMAAQDVVASAEIPGKIAGSKEAQQKADIVAQLATPEKLADPGAVAAIQAKIQDPTTDKADIPRLQALIPQAQAAQQQSQTFKEGVAKAEGVARGQAEAQIARGSNEALANVPKELITPVTAKAEALGTKYVTVASQLQNAKNLLAAAKNGDEVASAFAPVAAALGSNAFYGTHRLAPSEVQALGPGLGSVGREINTWFDKHATGTLAPNSVTEFNALIDRLGNAAKDEYKNGLNVTNNTYKSTFTPIEFSGTPEKPATAATAPRILSMDDIRKAARDNKVTVDQALAAAKAQGHTVQQ